MAPERRPSAIDGLLDALADERRRAIAYYLSDRSNGVASVSQLADHLLDNCAAVDDPESVAVRLHHVSLPKLHEAEVVDFDAQRHRVEYLEDPRVEELLGALRGRAETA